MLRKYEASFANSLLDPFQLFADEREYFRIEKTHITWDREEIGRPGYSSIMHEIALDVEKQVLEQRYEKAVQMLKKLQVSC